MTKLAWYAVAAGLLAGCGSSGGGAPAKSPNDQHNEMLHALGVDTNLGPRVNPAGAAVPADYNPTLRARTVVRKRSEPFLAGIQGQHGSETWFSPGGTVHAALDWPDGATAWQRSGLSGDDSWLRTPKAMAAADVDGDGKDEVVVAFLKASAQLGYDKDLVVRVLKLGGTGWAVLRERTIASYTNASITEYPSDGWYSINFQVSCGDVDGNGQRESLVTFNGEAFLIGDLAKDLGVLKTITYARSASQRSVLRTAAGDLDMDGKDELVVVESLLTSDLNNGTAWYHVYEGVTLAERDPRAVLSVTVGTDTVTLRGANVAIGDLDGDGVPEVVFQGTPDASGELYVFVLRATWSATLGGFEYALSPQWEHFTGRGNLLAPLFVADLDGDGANEILVHNRVYDVSRSGAAWTFTSKGVNLFTVAGIGTGYDSPGYAAVGDVDGDGAADFLTISDAWWQMSCVGVNAAGSWVNKTPIDTFDAGGYYPAIAAGDYDGDSVVVEFRGSELLFTDPHPIAVLAANPYWTGIDMPGQTSFGTSVGNEVEKETSVGVSLGVTISYENEGPFSLWKAGFEASFKSAFDWTASTTAAFEESYTYSTSGLDLVVFTTIPYDVYYYEVIAAPNAAAVGTVLTVNLPRKPVTLHLERADYAAKNGGAPDVTADALGGSRPGAPFSYPTAAAADTLIAAGGGQGVKSSQTLASGAGTTSIDMSVTNGKGAGTAFDFSVEVSAEAGAGGWTVGASAGFHYGESYKVSTTTSTRYGGQVGAMPTASLTSDRLFRWGLFSFRGSAGADRFVVVQYYVDPL